MQAEDEHKKGKDKKKPVKNRDIVGGQAPAQGQDPG